MLVGCENFSRVRLLEDKKIECIDWNIIINNNNYNNINYIGVRANSFFENYNNSQNINIKCRIKKIVEEIFSYVITVSPINSESEIIWHLQKCNYKKDYYIGMEINLALNIDNIMFLE